MKLFITAAWDPELERFRELTRATMPDIGPDDVGAVGIGLVDAATGTTRCVMRREVTDLVLLGTGGASPGTSLAIGDVVVASAVSLLDPAVVDGAAAIPFAATTVALGGARDDAMIRAGAKAARVANTLAVTTDDALAGRLAVHADVEHLEAFGVARACQQLGVSVSIVLGIANRVGASGRAEWRANHVAASARAAEVAAAGLREWLRTSTRERSPGRS